MKPVKVQIILGAGFDKVCVEFANVFHNGEVTGFVAFLPKDQGLAFAQRYFPEDIIEEPLNMRLNP